MEHISVTVTRRLKALVKSTVRGLHNIPDTRCRGVKTALVDVVMLALPVGSQLDIFELQKSVAVAVCEPEAVAVGEGDGEDEADTEVVEDFEAVKEGKLDGAAPKGTVELEEEDGEAEREFVLDREAVEEGELVAVGEGEGDSEALGEGAA